MAALLCAAGLAAGLVISLGRQPIPSSTTAMRTDIPNAAFLTARAIDTGYGEAVARLTGNEVASAEEAGPNQTCGHGAVSGYLHWVSREFEGEGGQLLGYERIVTYRSNQSPQAAVAASRSAATSCSHRLARDASYTDLSVSAFAASGLGSRDAAFEVSYSNTTPTGTVQHVVEYVAELAVRNVYAEVVLTGQKLVGLDPGRGAALFTSAAAEERLMGLYVGGSSPRAVISSNWTAFFNGSTPTDKKALLLQHGPADVRDIGLFFGLLPKDLTTKIASVRLDANSAVVTYEFFSGSHPLSGRPQTGTAIRVGDRWIVSASTWARLVKISDIHGSD
ncbi:MAG: hypothetical protein ACREGR_00790 [Minisyncoccia bacterium]